MFFMWNRARSAKAPSFMRGTSSFIVRFESASMPANGARSAAPITFPLRNAALMFVARCVW